MMTSADIMDFFDNIDREKLLKIIQSRLPDNSLDFLIVQLLEPNVCKKDRYTHVFNDLPVSNSGVGQGSIISPLLSNIYLMSFDKKLEKLKIPSLRYADDFAFFSKSSSEAKENLIKIQEILKNETGLSFHPDTDKKRTKDFNLNSYGIFLGIRLSKHLVNRWEIVPESKKIKEMEKKIREKLKFSLNESLFEAINDLNKSLKSWIECYIYVGCTSRAMKEIYSGLRDIYEAKVNDILIKKKITLKNLNREQLNFLGVLRLKIQIRKKNKRKLI